MRLRPQLLQLALDVGSLASDRFQPVLILLELLFEGFGALSGKGKGKEGRGKGNANE
jgi:hypothetical protein